MVRTAACLLLCCVAVLFAGCGGGGGSAASVPPRASASATPGPGIGPESIAQSAYALSVVADLPLAYYRFGDAGSGAQDVSGHNLAGTSGPAIVRGVAGLLANDGDAAARFPGGAWDAGGIVRVPANALLRPSSALTVECWVRTDAAADDATLLSYGDNLTEPRQPYVLRTETKTNAFVFGVVAGGALQQVTSKTPLAPGKTFHVVGTYNGGSLAIYVNGVLETSAPASGAIGHYDAVNGLAIGGRVLSGGTLFSGTIDEVAIYGAPLAATRIAAHYALGALPAAMPSPTPSAVPGASAGTPAPLAGTPAPAVASPAAVVTTPVPVAATAAPVVAPTPSPAPVVASGCAPAPAFTNGAPYSASWAPYDCASSPFNVPVSRNPQFASYSAQAIATMFASGNTQPVRDQEAGAYDFGHPVVFASASDPLVRINCTGYCNRADNGGYPAQLRIPAGTHAAGGSDAHLAVVQPDGTEIDFWATQPGTWTAGGTITATAVANCGNFFSGSGFTPTGPAATAGGACLGAGNLRANELIAGRIPHALFLISQCAVGWQYPAFPGASTQQCSSGVGAPLGGRLWYDVPCSTTQAAGSLRTWEKAILCALNEFGGYLMDNISGGPQQSGILFLAESGQPAVDFGKSDPFAALAAQGWSTNSVSGALQLRYVGADPWQPAAVDFRSHLHWLAPCSAQRTC